MQFLTFPPLRLSSLKPKMHECLDENSFQRILSRERKRAERSGRPFLLMTVNVAPLIRADHSNRVQSELLSALTNSTRETDILGWLQDGVRLGIIFSETYGVEGKAPESVIRAKVTGTLSVRLGNKLLEQMDIEFVLIPDESDVFQRRLQEVGSSGQPANEAALACSMIES